MLLVASPAMKVGANEQKEEEMRGVTTVYQSMLADLEARTKEMEAEKARIEESEKQVIGNKLQEFGPGI